MGRGNKSLPALSDQDSKPIPCMCVELRPCYDGSVLWLLFESLCTNMTNKDDLPSFSHIFVIMFE